jgi:hypothetical protein
VSAIEPNLVEAVVDSGAKVGPRPAVAVLAIIALASLDLLGAVLAKHWAEHRNVTALVGGILVFVVLFVVYGRSLAYAELATVTFGWIVLLQVGVLVLDRFRYGAALGGGRIAAMVAILALQAYLVLSPTPTR